MSRRAACPASATREDGYPNTENPAAALGTILHELAALVLTGDMDLPSVRDRVDERSAAQVEAYVAYVLSRQAEIGGHLLVEQRFHIPLHDELWGTADAVIANPEAGVIEVIDLKTGGGVDVPARDASGRANIQLSGYLLGALHTTPGAFERMTVTIVQPRRGGIKQASVTWDDLLTLSADLVDIIERALGPNPPAKPGDHCLFCRAKPDCKEYAQRSLIEARAAFDAEPIPAGFA